MSIDSNINVYKWSGDILTSTASNVSIFTDAEYIPSPDPFWIRQSLIDYNNAIMVSIQTEVLNAYRLFIEQ
jgi:hypothetical protein